MDADAVSDAILFAAEHSVTPRFRALRAGDVEEKSPGELVTIADRECETVLTDLLRSVRDVPVVGEEAASADQSLVAMIGTRPAVWVVDPLDGTSNFAAGSADHAVMVAFVEQGQATHSWIWQPQHEVLAVAGLGSGAFVNGARTAAAAPSLSTSDLRGVVKERFLPTDITSIVRTNAHQFAPFSAGSNCAGVDYPNLVGGTVDFLFYWRTLPWDHAPGVLFAEEAGCIARRPNGDDFHCGADRDGLLVAHSRICATIRRALLQKS